MRIVIIGAGPTGLGAAYRLQELGYDNWSIFEASDHVGGLALDERLEIGLRRALRGDDLARELLRNQALDPALLHDGTATGALGSGILIVPRAWPRVKMP